MNRQVMLLLAPLLLAAGPVAAATYTLGDQDFTDGTSGSLTAFEAASVGEAAPFDRFRGSDFDTDSPFTAAFTFNYAPTANIGAATITFGMYDSDSLAPGFQVASFTLNGTDLTTLLNLAFEAKAVPQGTNAVFSLALPDATFAGLAAGTAAFSLTLQGPGLPVGTASNGAGLDFATLDLGNGGGVVPEPATWAMMIGGFGLAGGSLRRRPAAVPATA